MPTPVDPGDKVPSDLFVMSLMIDDCIVMLSSTCTVARGSVGYLVVVSSRDSKSWGPIGLICAVNALVTSGSNPCPEHDLDVVHFRSVLSKVTSSVVVPRSLSLQVPVSWHVREF